MSESEQRSLWIAGGAVVAALVGLWLTGAVSAAVFGAGWTPIATAEVPATAVRLSSHLNAPAAAWPDGTRYRLPGAGAFYLTGIVVTAGIAGVAVALFRIADELGLAALVGGTRKPPAARWAHGRDLRELRVPAAQPKRLTLGRFGRSLIAAGERQSVIVIAPTQTHKTTGLAIPALLEWEGPVLATSVKSDLLIDTVPRREALGEVMAFDPTRATEMERTRVSPLWGAGTYRGALRVAHRFAGAAKTSAGAGLGDADFWFASAEKLLAPLLFAAAANGRTMGAVVRWLDEGAQASEEEVLGLLAEAGEDRARRAYLATQNREERQRSSVYTTAEMIVSAFADPDVLEETAAADYSPTRLLDGGANTLYLCAPLHEQERLRPLFSAIVQELLSVVYESAAASGEPLDPPLLLLLDEAANIAPIPDLDKIAATAAGQGVQLLSVFQDFAQIKAVYGPRAPSIVNNHRAKLFGPENSDPETSAYVRELAGLGEFEQRSRTAGEKGRQSTTEGDMFRDLAPGHVLREGRLSTAMLIYGGLPPAWIGLRLWFEDAGLKRLREGSPIGPDSGEVGT